MELASSEERGSHVELSDCSGTHNDVRIVLRDKEYSVSEISAMVLQEMKLIAEDYLVRRSARRSSPSRLLQRQPRQATKDAVKSPGSMSSGSSMNPLLLLSYGFGKNVEKTIAVYDSAAAHSTSRYWRSARAESSRSSLRPAILSSAAKTSTPG